MRPIDFEDARDQINSIPLENLIRTLPAAARRYEEQKKREEQRRIDRHPRTRLSRFLTRLSLRIALPKDEC